MEPTAESLVEHIKLLPPEEISKLAKIMAERHAYVYEKLSWEAENYCYMLLGDLQGKP